MRISSAKCALVVLAVVLLVGCKSSDSRSKPRSSLSKLNPFSAFSDKSLSPPKPSELASPAPTMSPAAGYAAASSQNAAPSAYPSAATDYAASSGGYPSTQYSYPSTSPGSLAGPTTTGNPATTPQDGYYSPRAGSLSPGSPSSAPASSEYRVAGATGPYANVTPTAPRYGVVSDRYALNRAASDQSSDLRAGPANAADPYASFPADNSQYANNPQAPGGYYRDPANSGYGATTAPPPERDASSTGFASPGSRYPAVAAPEDNRYEPSGSAGYGSGGSNAGETNSSGPYGDSGSRYGAGPSSVAGDRYARADSDSAGTGYGSYRNGQLASSQGDTEWTPGNTGYQPGGPTANMPGRIDYQPGNTGYNPPGVSPYRSPANTSTASPFLPGSTRLYAPRRTNLSDAPGDSPSPPNVPPRTDSYVIPASHRP